MPELGTGVRVERLATTNSTTGYRDMSDVRTFGAVGDGQADDTAAIRHCVQDGDGLISFSRGRYRIRQTIEIPLDRFDRVGIDGSRGTATVVMDGPGPAFRLIGTHAGTGDPGTVAPAVWMRQRMPTVSNIEVTATNPEADGFELIETMQPIFDGVLIRQVRHGIRLHKRNRNVLINDSHIYHNTGVGVFLDQVNLHQINITGNHISYNRLGGIRIAGSEVRNLQITGNDIEYNNHRQFDTPPEPTAEIYIDTTAERSSVAEVAVSGNTIQATSSPGGANIRIVNAVGDQRPPGLWTVTGNIIGSQENNIHLTGCYGVVVSGNFIYSGGLRNVLLEQCREVTLTGNSFRRHTPAAHTGVRIVDSSDCVLSGCSIQDESEEGQKTGASLLEIEQCQRINVQGCQLLNGVPFGIDARRAREVNINGCTIADTREQGRSRAAIRFREAGAHNLISACTIGRTQQAALQLDDVAGVKVTDVVGDGV